MNATNVEGQNSHVRKYLDYYISFPHSPHFAVLLNGPWGIGKTFLVRNILAKHFAKAEDEYVYISLYGLGSTREIDEALLAALYPALSGKGAKIVGRVVKSVLSYTGISTDLSAGDFLDKYKAKMYIFDDLERCELKPINKVLGYINEFVEHDNCKVIIVANESEIDDNVDYRRKREKLVGKTLEVRSSFDEAFACFATLIDDSNSKKFLLSKKEDVHAIYYQSTLNNLRILQQTMWDFERVFSILSASHRKNAGAMGSLLGMFFALSFEVKSGRLSKPDLASRKDGIMARFIKSEEPEAFQVSQARYPEIELGDPILSNELLVDILANGIIDAKAIRESLDRSSYFVRPGDEPAWRTVWYALERSDSEFSQAVESMEKQFAAREFTVTGEILHVFGLRLQLIEMGVITKSRSCIVSECKKYIDDIYIQRKIEPIPLVKYDDFRSDGYGGLGIYGTQSPEYKELYDYLKSKRQLAAIDLLPSRAEDLLLEMQSDPSLYFRRLCLTNSSDNLYYQIPILSYIDVDRFVEALLAQSTAHQRVILSAFEGRYREPFKNDLAKEMPWLHKVRDRLLEASVRMTSLGKYRMEKFIEWYVAPFLSE